MTQEYTALYLEQPVLGVNITALFIGVVTLREHASEKLKCVKWIRALLSACKAIMKTYSVAPVKSITSLCLAHKLYI